MSPEPAVGGTACPIPFPHGRRAGLAAGEAWRAGQGSGMRAVPPASPASLLPAGHRCSAVPRDQLRSCERSNWVRATLHPC